MSRSVEDIRQDAMALPAIEREALAESLYESLGDFDPEVQAIWVEEAERRWKEYELGGIQGIPWEEVSEQLRQRFGA